MGKALVIKGADFSQVAVDVITISVTAPTISISQQGEVTLANDDNYDMYYTTDGSTPTTSSTKYTVPFTVADGVTVKAITVFGSNVSSVASNQYIAPIVMPTGYTALDYLSGITNGFVAGPSSNLLGTKWEFDAERNPAPSAVEYLLYTTSSGGRHLDALTTGKWGLGATKATNVACTSRTTLLVTIPSSGDMTLTINGAVTTGGAPGNGRNFLYSGTSGMFGGKVWSIKGYLISDDSLIFNGVPAQRDSDSKKGIYDFVGNTFYPCQV